MSPIEQFAGEGTNEHYSAMSATIDFKLYNERLDIDPFPDYRILRDEAPCYWVPDAKAWIITRYDDVVTAAKDWETFSSQSGNLIDEMPGRAGGSLGTTDPPKHDRLRRLVQFAFSRQHIADFEPTITSICQQTFDALDTSNSFDFVEKVCSPITVNAIMALLGFETDDAVKLRRDVVLSIATDKALKGRSVEMDVAFGEVKAFVETQIKVAKNDGMIGRLRDASVAGSSLSEREVTLTATMFVIAGIESLSGFLAMAMLNLGQFPQVQKEVRNSPELIPAFIEETLRFNGSAQRFGRAAARDLELHGQHIRKGDKVILAYGSANRDERRFKDPDSFDIHRDTSGHLGLGIGVHFCIGNILARMISRHCLTHLLASSKELVLVDKGTIWNSSSNFRTPQKLLVQCAEG